MTEDHMTDNTPTTPPDPLRDLMSQAMPALEGLEIALRALPTGAYRSVSASATGPHGETVTLTFSLGEPVADE